MAFSFCFDIKKFFLCMNNLFIRKGLIKRKIMQDKRRNHEIIGEYAYSAKAKKQAETKSHTEMFA